MLKHQRKFWDLENRIVLLIGGYGSGKTYIGALKCIQMSYLNAPIPGMYISPSHQLATKTIIETLKDICNRASINYTYNQQRSEFIFHNWNGVLWFGSGDKPDSLRGSNIAYSVIDEPFIQKREVFNQMIARVRHPDAVKSQIFLTGTPEQLNWGFALANDQSMDIGIVNASTLDNPHLSDEYKQSLLKAYSQEQIDAYVHGKFVNLTQGRVYKEFDREKHVIERPDLKEAGLEIGIAMDYNVDALTSIIFYKGNGWIHVFDEVRLKNANTYDMMEVLSKKYPQSVCYPDSSGSARRSSSVQSDHAIVRSYGFTISAPKANPPVKDRVNAVNKLIREGNFSCENCPNLIMDLERNVWKGNDIDKTSDKEQTHASDALGYAINRLYPVRRRVMVSKSW